jgi:hypothetical protein
MHNRMVLAAMVLLCVSALGARAQMDTCGGPTGVCPPTGTDMGQSDYQRTPHPNVYTPAAPTCVTTTPMTPAESAPPTTTPYLEPSAPAGTGLGPPTPPESSKIAVDENYVYVLQGHEVVKLDKNDLRVVARTKIPPPSAPRHPR